MREVAECAILKQVGAQRKRALGTDSVTAARLSSTKRGRRRLACSESAKGRRQNIPEAVLGFYRIGPRRRPEGLLRRTHRI
jgi:hypothetical protein